MLRLPQALRFGPQFGVTQHHSHHPDAPQPAGDAPTGGGMYFSEMVLYMAVFTIPVAVMFYMLGGPLVDWMNTEIMPMFEASAK